MSGEMYIWLLKLVYEKTGMLVSEPENTRRQLKVGYEMLRKHIFEKNYPHRMLWHAPQWSIQSVSVQQLRDRTALKDSSYKTDYGMRLGVSERKLLTEMVNEFIISIYRRGDDMPKPDQMICGWKVLTREYAELVYKLTKVLMEENRGSEPEYVMRERQIKRMRKMIVFVVQRIIVLMWMPDRRSTIFYIGGLKGQIHEYNLDGNVYPLELQEGTIYLSRLQVENALFQEQIVKTFKMLTEQVSNGKDVIIIEEQLTKVFIVSLLLTFVIPLTLDESDKSYEQLEEKYFDAIIGVEEPRDEQIFNNARKINGVFREPTKRLLEGRVLLAEFIVKNYCAETPSELPIDIVRNAVASVRKKSLMDVAFIYYAKEVVDAVVITDDGAKDMLIPEKTQLDEALVVARDCWSRGLPKERDLNDKSVYHRSRCETPPHLSCPVEMIFRRKLDLTADLEELMECMGYENDDVKIGDVQPVTLVPDFKRKRTFEDVTDDVQNVEISNGDITDRSFDFISQNVVDNTKVNGRKRVTKCGKFGNSCFFSKQRARGADFVEDSGIFAEEITDPS